MAQGCWVLFNLSLEDAAEHSVAQKGGIEAVVQAMGAHRSSVGIQVTTQNLGFMVTVQGKITTHMLQSCSNFRCQSLKRKIRVPELIRRRWGDLSRTATLQEVGCWLLYNFALVDGLRERVQKPSTLNPQPSTLNPQP